MDLDAFFAGNIQVEMYQILTLQNTINAKIANSLRAALAPCSDRLAAKGGDAFVACQFQADRTVKSLLESKKAFLGRYDAIEVG